MAKASCQNHARPKLSKANGIIRYRISSERSQSSSRGRKPCDAVIFTPDHAIKHGKHKFAAFVPEGKDCDGLGFVVKLHNGSIDLALDGFACPNLAFKAALSNTKVTVIVSAPNKAECRPKLKALVVPAEPAE